MRVRSRFVRCMFWLAITVLMVAQVRAEPSAPSSMIITVAAHFVSSVPSDATVGQVKNCCLRQPKPAGRSIQRLSCCLVVWSTFTENSTVSLHSCQGAIAFVMDTSVHRMTCDHSLVMFWMKFTLCSRSTPIWTNPTVARSLRV